MSEIKKKSRQEKRREERERQKTLKKSNVDLFNNPMVQSAKKALTPEQQEEYKRMGEHMYNTIDFENPETDPLAEFAAYVHEGLKSGLHPKDLEEDEVKAMVEFKGDEWYKEYGYDYTEEQGYTSV